jgi:hypothetical protein
LQVERVEVAVKAAAVARVNLIFGQQLQERQLIPIQLQLETKGTNLQAVHRPVLMAELHLLL